MVGHDVVVPRDEGEFGTITVVALVLAEALGKVRRRAGGGSGPLKHA